MVKKTHLIYFHKQYVQSYYIIKGWHWGAKRLSRDIQMRVLWSMRVSPLLNNKVETLARYIAEPTLSTMGWLPLTNTNFNFIFCGNGRFRPSYIKCTICLAGSPFSLKVPISKSTRSETWTHMGNTAQQILSLSCLPIPTFWQVAYLFHNR